MKLKLNCISFYFDLEHTEYGVKYIPSSIQGHYNVDVLRNSFSFARFNTYGSANKTHAKALIERALREQKLNLQITE